MEWRDIETAPKDGTLIDLYAQERKRYQNQRIPDCFFYKEKWRHLQTIYDEDTDDELSEIFNPTHWMHRPKPPTQSARDE